MGRKAIPVELTFAERETLERASADPTAPRKARRAQIVLAAAEGLSNMEIALRLGCSLPTVGKWRRRFVERRLPGLADEARPGRPALIGEASAQQILEWTLSPSPQEGRWTAQHVARVLGVSRATLYRVRKRLHLHHQRRIMRTGPRSAQPYKPRERLVGLHLHPPQAIAAFATLPSSGSGAIQPTADPQAETVSALCVDPLPRVREHLYAACSSDYRHPVKGRVREAIAFLRQLEGECRVGEIRLIAHNAALLDHEDVRRWLDRRPRFTVERVSTKSEWVKHVVAVLFHHRDIQERLAQALLRFHTHTTTTTKGFNWVSSPLSKCLKQMEGTPCQKAIGFCSHPNQ